MKKRLILSLLAMVLLLGTLAPAAYATALEERHVADGTCGEGLSWSLDGYTLTITGDGEMDDGCPWIEHMDRIEHVKLDGAITKIGKEAFYKFDRLETVDFGEALVEIGVRAFYGCDDIEYLHLPATFRKFGAESFRECMDLKFVYCDGPMPRFEDSCLYTGNYIAVFYPTNNPWPNEYTSQLVNNFGGRLGIMMGNFDELVVKESLAEYADEDGEETEATEAEDETTAVTEAPTEAPTEVPTVPPTEAPTVPATEAPTVAPTEAPTVPVVILETEPAQSIASETMEPLDLAHETEPVIEETVKSRSWIGLVMIAGVLTFLLAGAMIFRSVSRKNRY